MRPIPPALTAPWAMEPSFMRVVCGVWARSRGMDLFAEDVDKARADVDGFAGGDSDVYRVIDGVAVIAIRGPLMRHAGMLAQVSNATSYASIWQGLEMALADPAVSAILLRCNSPGGTVDGLGELARFIYAVRDVKPIAAHVDQLCASACYWLASQTSRITACAEAEAGSIGAIRVLVDDSKADEIAGVREIQIVSSQSPKKRSAPIDGAVLDAEQIRIDDAAALFVEAVARGRSVDEDAVLSDFGQGGLMVAAKAKAAGLIDEVMDFNAALGALRAEATKRPAGAPRMYMSKPTQAAASAVPDPALAVVDPARAEEEHAPPMRCAKCDGDVSGKKCYCAACYDGEHDEPDGDEDEEAKAAAAFGRKALALVGGTDMDAALGTLAAWKDGHAQLAAHLETEAKATASKARADVVAAVDGAIKSKRLTLGSVSSLAAMIDDDGRARAFAAAVDGAAGDGAAVLAAVSAQEWTAAESKRIGAMLGTAKPVLPAPHNEPPHDERTARAASATPEQLRKYGINPEAWSKYAGIDSVADLPRSTK